MGFVGLKPNVFTKLLLYIRVEANLFAWQAYHLLVNVVPSP